MSLNPKHKETFMEEARRRFAQANDYERPRREQAREDWRFYAGYQWAEELVREREEHGRPCLTVNRCNPFAKQVINQVRSQKPQAQIHPLNDADEDDAEVRQGITRHIEVISDAELAYDAAVTAAVVGGFGYWRLVSEYCDEMSFDQELKIKRILDPFTVYFDPNAQEPDRSDAQFCFVRERMSLEAHKRAFGKDVEPNMYQALDEGDNWMDADGFCHVAEYFYVTHEETTLCKWVDAQGKVRSTPLERVPAKAKVIAQRPTTIPKVGWCKINGIEILEEYEWPGRWIPIVPLFGDELVINGETHTVGLIRHMRDPQRMFNYLKSAITERIGTATAAKWLAAAGQTEGFETLWENANKPGHPVLYYKPVVDDRGNLLPAPAPIMQESGIQDLAENLMQTDQDLKTVTGLFDASIGNAKTDQSGKAVQALQAQGNLATFGFGDNLIYSIKHSTRQLLDLIPHYYDAGRVMMLEGLDGKKKSVYVYNSETNPDPDMQQAVKDIYDLSKGAYAVTVSVGPSFETQRQQDVDFWLGLVQKFPEIMPVAGDIIVSLMDSPESRAVAARLKVMLPEQVQQLLQGGQPPTPQEQQLHQQNTQLQQALQQLHMEKQAKLMDGQFKDQMNARDNLTKLAIAQVTASQDQDQFLAQQDAQQLESVLGVAQQGHAQAHEAGMTAMKHAHSLQQGAQAAQNDQQATAQDQSFQADQNQQGQQFQAQQSDAERQHQAMQAKLATPKPTTDKK